jgi:uncharacterized protein (DUF58 family)
VDLDELIALRLRAARLRLDAVHPRAMGASPGITRFRGRGMDYTESRAYLPGDDSRHMDWKVTARRSEAHMKVFQEERERPVFLLVELGDSMFFGTRGSFKSVLAARAAALLAWAALAGGDRVGALVAAATSHLECAPATGRRGVLRVLQALARLGRFPGPPRGEPRPVLVESVQRVHRVIRPGSLVVVLSDFYGLDAAAGQHLRRLRAHNDLLLVRVVDRLETEPPAPGRYPVAGAGETLVLDARDDGVRAAYRKFHRDRRERVADLCRQLPALGLELRTGEDPVRSLESGLAAPAAA